MPIIETNATKGTTTFTNGFKNYDWMVDFGYQKHFRIKHSDKEFATGYNHINGIEGF